MFLKACERPRPLSSSIYYAVAVIFPINREYLSVLPELKASASLSTSMLNFFWPSLFGYITSDDSPSSSWYQSGWQTGRRNAGFNNLHLPTTTSTVYFGSRFYPGQCPVRIEPQQQLKHLNQAFAVGVQKTKITCAGRPDRDNVQGRPVPCHRNRQICNPQPISPGVVRARSIPLV